MSEPEEHEAAARRRWLSLMAKAEVATLERAWRALPEQPAYQLLRRPEVGLVMVRGRAGGTGRRFNLGETTVSRCTVRLDDGAIGFGYLLGRELRQAELIALFDALLQDPEWYEEYGEALLAPLAAEQQAEREAVSRKAAATRVDFFTMVRGD